MTKISKPFQSPPTQAGTRFKMASFKNFMIFMYAYAFLCMGVLAPEELCRWSCGGCGCLMWVPGTELTSSVKAVHSLSYSTAWCNTSFWRKKVLGSWALTQWLKCLLHKHEDWISDLHKPTAMPSWPAIPALERRDGIPRAIRLARQVTSVSSGFDWEILPQWRGKSNQKWFPTSTLPIHVHNTHTLHTHTKRNKRQKSWEAKPASSEREREVAASL